MSTKNGTMNTTIANLIGNSPLIDLSALQQNPRIRLEGKLEGQNPGGSVKDRAALSMIDGALRRGEIRPGAKLVEATSGNTGIALAMIAAAKGLHITLLMPEGSTPERVRTMQAFGAKVILTPAEKTIEYSRELASEMAMSGEYFQLDQFANPDNWAAHYRTTGPEIWRDTRGEITHFVSSMGTTGTIMGVSRYLKEQNPGITIVGVQPAAGAKIPGIRRWTPEFVPAIYDASRVDEKLDVSQQEATETARMLAHKLGVFTGMSSGGAVAAALRLASGLEQSTIVCILCDRGDRYLSSDLFE